MNPYLDSETVCGKVEDAIRRKLKEMYPCSEHEWRDALKEFGIVVRMWAEDGYRSGFQRVADPMRSQIFDGRGEYIKKWGGALYVPDDVVNKILVLGALP